MTAIENTFEQAEQASATRRARRREDRFADGWTAGLQNMAWRNQLQDFWTLSRAQTAITWVMLAALVAMAAVFLLVQASAVATVGREIQDLQFQLNTIRQQNSDLERQIAQAQSIEVARSRASQLGFRNATPEETMYLVVPEFPPRPAPFDPFPELNDTAVKAEPVESMQEAIKMSFYQTISGFIEGSAD
ncbi:MAG: hypothetical protein AAGD96_00790 [Chloroflexota bacterium]